MGWTSWEQARDALLGVFAKVHADPAAFAVLDLGERYVQWHGEERGWFYAEASSGHYEKKPLDEASRQTLAALGWAPPGMMRGYEDQRNWIRVWTPPADAGAVVDCTLSTLLHAYGASPESIALQVDR